MTDLDRTSFKVGVGTLASHTEFYLSSGFSKDIAEISSSSGLGDSSGLKEIAAETEDYSSFVVSFMSSTWGAISAISGTFNLRRSAQELSSPPSFWFEKNVLAKLSVSLFCGSFTGPSKIKDYCLVYFYFTGDAPIIERNFDCYYLSSVPSSGNSFWSFSANL